MAEAVEGGLGLTLLYGGPLDLAPLARAAARWASVRGLGMRIGSDMNFPLPISEYRGPNGKQGRGGRVSCLLSLAYWHDDACEPAYSQE